MKFLLFFIVLSFLLIPLYGGGDVHETDMEKKTCINCHKEATPDIVAQWEKSAHGFTQTKCGVCHGDKDNFLKSPGKVVCMACHAEKVENMVTKGKKCQDCHPVHHFTMHKVKDYTVKDKKGGKK